MLPNFLVVGAEKAGTTTLADALGQHPEVFLAAVKEVRYFSNHYDEGLGWYERHFDGAAGARAVGEASPSYAHPKHPKVPERIARTLGDAVRFVYIVRHPVARAISHYRHGLHLHWWPPSTTFAEAIARSDSILGCSRYWQHLERYLPYSDRSRWHILTLEDLKRDPEATYRDLFRFLGVDEGFRPERRALNTAAENKLTPSWFERVRGAIGTSARLIPGPARSALRRMLTRELPEPTISEAMTRELEAQFLPDAAALGEFVGRDLVRLWGLGAGAVEPVSGGSA